MTSCRLAVLWAAASFPQQLWLVVSVEGQCSRHCSMSLIGAWIISIIRGWPGWDTPGPASRSSRWTLEIFLPFWSSFLMTREGRGEQACRGRADNFPWIARKHSLMLPCLQFCWWPFGMAVQCDWGHRTVRGCRGNAYWEGLVVTEESSRFWWGCRQCLPRRCKKTNFHFLISWILVGQGLGAGGIKRVIAYSGKTSSCQQSRILIFLVLLNCGLVSILKGLLIIFLVLTVLDTSGSLCCLKTEFHVIRVSFSVCTHPESVSWQPMMLHGNLPQIHLSLLLSTTAKLSDVYLRKNNEKLYWGTTPTIKQTPSPLNPRISTEVTTARPTLTCKPSCGNKWLQ